MKNSKQLVFIDDSGDPDFKTASSSNFVIAAAVFIDPAVAILLSTRISEYRNIANRSVGEMITNSNLPRFAKTLLSVY